MYTGGSSRPGRDADHSPPSTTDVTFTPLYVFKECIFLCI
jgi:hypothetical protein